MRKEICLLLDVEAAGSIEKPLVYDLGLLVIERTTGRILEEYSLVIRDVFFDRANEMESAYYADKIPDYYQKIRAGEHRVVRFWTAWRLVREIITRYNIRRVYAYNCAYDRRALNNTFRTVSGHGGYFFPRGMEYCCLWHMACQTIFKQKRYRRFALAHGLVSPAGNLRTSAEVAFGYTTNNPEYVESHTGLEDAKIEAYILGRILAQKKRVDERLIAFPWKIPQGVSA